MLEFADTPTYQVLKETQRFQSEVGRSWLEISEMQLCNSGILKKKVMGSKKIIDWDPK